MKKLKSLLILIILIFTCSLFAQQISISNLFFTKLDYGFKLSSSGAYMAAARDNPSGYFILITDLKTNTIFKQLPMGNYKVYNINWISDKRLTYEQTGALYAINIDGSEKQQLISVWKDKVPEHYDYSFLKK